MLEDYNGFAVDIFNNPTEALSNFKSGLYDLVLLDVKMPKMNGLELYERIKEIDGNVRVCFITAYELYYEALKAQYPPSENIECFIAKPISIDALLKKIKEKL